jgi:hypothetical protein
MKVFVLAVVLVVVTGESPSSAQLIIQNPHHLPVPEQKASVLMSTACRVITEHFALSKGDQHPLRLTLVLGSSDEHYTAEGDKDAYTLFLQRWDENKFTLAVTNLAIQRLVVNDRLASLVSEILRRSEQVAPVPAAQLRGSRISASPLAGQASGCFSAITEAAVRKIPCGPSSHPGLPSSDAPVP